MLVARVVKAKFIKVNESIGECSKCKTKWKLGKCCKGMAARFIVEEEDGGKQQSVSAFDDVLNGITEGIQGADVAERLMNWVSVLFGQSILQ